MLAPRHILRQTSQASTEKQRRLALQCVRLFQNRYRLWRHLTRPASKLPLNRYTPTDPRRPLASTTLPTVTSVPREVDHRCPLSGTSGLASSSRPPASSGSAAVFESTGASKPAATGASPIRGTSVYLPKKAYMLRGQLPRESV